MIKDRFGGLFSGLNKRDIQTLQNFEWFLSDSSENTRKLLSTYPPYIETQYSPGKTLLPDADEFDSLFGDVEDQEGGLGGWIGDSLESIYSRFSEYYWELHRQCQDFDTNWKSFDQHYYRKVPAEHRQELVISVKQECRIQLSKVAPVLKKLKKLVDKSQNQALD